MAVHVPSSVGAVSVVATVPFTDLLNPAKARRRLAEQRAKPIKARELKKADREVEFVFIGMFSLVERWVSFLNASSDVLSSRAKPESSGNERPECFSS